MIISQNELQVVMNFNKDCVKNLLTSDFETWSIDQKNELIVVLALESGKQFNEITPQYILDYHKEMKKDELNQACDDTICKGFTASNGHTYRTNRDDQTNMIGQKDEVNSDPTISIVPWKTEDSGYINHSREEWLSIYSQAFAFKKQQLFKYDSLKTDVKSETTATHAQINSIVW